MFGKFLITALAALALVGCGPQRDPMVYKAAFERCMELADQDRRALARVSLSPADECERFAYNVATMEAETRGKE